MTVTEDLRPRLRDTERSSPVRAREPSGAAGRLGQGSPPPWDKPSRDCLGKKAHQGLESDSLSWFDPVWLCDVERAVVSWLWQEQSC